MMIRIEKNLQWKLDGRIADLNKFLAKKGIEQKISYEVKGEETVKYDGTTYTFLSVSVNTPFENFQVVDGVTYLGLVKEDEDGAVMVLSTSEKSIRHHEKSRHCDHCHSNRNRKKVYIFDKEGAELVIGSTCVDNYFSIDVEKFLSASEVLSQLENLEGEFDELSRCRRSNFTAVAKTAFWLINKEGKYVSRDNAGFGVMSTADTITDIIFPPKAEYMTAERLEKQRAIEKEIEEYYTAHTDDYNTVIQFWADMTPTNDFEFNVKSQFEHASDKRVAMIACGFWRLLKEKMAKGEEGRINEWFGTQGDKYTATVTLAKASNFESAYGTGCLYSFKDSAGHVFKWFSKPGFDAEVGDELTIKFTVKAHTEYKGFKETQILRVKKM